MSEQNFENTEASMEELLTLVLMGEADAATIMQVEAALEVDPDLRARRDSMVHTLGLLKEAAPAVGIGALNEARRNTLRSAAQQQLQPRRWRPTPLLSAAALLLLVSGVAYVNQDRWTPPTADLHASAEMGYIGEGAYKGPGDSVPPGIDGAAEQLLRDITVETRGLANAPAGESDDASSLAAEKMKDVFVRKELASLGYSDGEVAEYAQRVEAERGRNAPTKDEGALALALRDLNNQTQPNAPRSNFLTTPSSPAPSKKGSAPVDSEGFRARNHWFGGKEVKPEAKVYLEANSDLTLLARSEGLYSADAEDAADGVKLGLPMERSAESSAGASFDDFEQGDIRARTENILGEYNDRLQLEAGPRCVVHDGYGRRYVDRRVIEHLHPEYHNETPRDMFFRYYGDNAEVITKLDPMSTFAADVDTASYPMARNYLVNGTLPPKQAIRTEEFVNYFDYELAAPTEGDFAVHLRAMPSLFGGDAGRTLLSIGIKAREVLDEHRKPMNLVFVIDKSGSMAGARMELVKKSLELLVDQMQQEDTLGIVTFDSNGHIMLEPTSAKQRWKLREVIRNLTTGGSTNAGEGLEMGYKMMETCFSKDRINRLVLASDGVANTGETDQARILQSVRAQAEADVDLTTLGVGMGNHNDVFLEQLANKGDGSCHYIDDYDEAKRVLVEQFLGTMVTIARDVKIQVEFDSKVVSRWRQLGYENRSLKHADFRNDAIDAGEVGSGHEVTALYELETLGTDFGANDKLVTVRLRWFPDGSGEAVEQEFQMEVSAVTGRAGLAPARLRLAAVVAQYAEVLRLSYHARSDSYLSLRQEADKLVKELQGDQDVRELRDMIERTVDLARWSPPMDELSILMESMREQQLQSAQLRLLGGENEETAILLASIELQNMEIEKRMLQLLEE